MIYAMIDLSGNRVVDVFAVAEDPKLTTAQQKELFANELKETYAKLTGNGKRKFATTEAIKEAIGEYLQKHTFSGKAPQKLQSAKTDGPVATARGICRQLHGRKRWEIIEACAKAGVKRSTASAQYQIYKTNAAGPQPTSH